MPACGSQCLVFTGSVTVVGGELVYHGCVLPHLCDREPGTGSQNTRRRAIQRRRKRGLPIYNVAELQEQGTEEQETSEQEAEATSPVPHPADDREDMAVCCRECKVEFVFSVEEQRLFLSHGWPIPRQRCEPCMLRRKQSKRSKASKQHQPPSDQKQELAPAANPTGADAAAAVSEPHAVTRKPAVVVPFGMQSTVRSR